MVGRSAALLDGELIEAGEEMANRYGGSPTSAENAVAAQSDCALLQRFTAARDDASFTDSSAATARWC
jgi:hypothetical protein